MSSKAGQRNHTKLRRQRDEALVENTRRVALLAEVCASLRDAARELEVAAGHLPADYAQSARVAAHRAERIRTTALKASEQLGSDKSTVRQPEACAKCGGWRDGNPACVCQPAGAGAP